jgi:enterochelin esterase-like enzyme
LIGRAFIACCLAFLPSLALAAPSEVHRSESFMSRALGHDLTYAIYLPADLDPHIRLPVIYLLHGADGHGLDWVDQGHVQAAADRLIAEHRLPKVIIVMPDAQNSWYVDSPPSGLGAMGTAIERDLPDWIESHYPARSARSGRAVAGYSMGGFGALDFALGHPERYAAVAAMSGAFWTWMKPDFQIDPVRNSHYRNLFEGAFGDPFDPKRFVANSPMDMLDHMPGTAPHPAILLICGRQDDFHLDQEQAVMEHRLEAAHLVVEAELIPGGHDWDTWSAALPTVLEFLGRHLHQPVRA